MKCKNNAEIQRGGYLFEKKLYFVAGYAKTGRVQQERIIY